eukprot:ANDGO_07803.mRNA.1 Ras guanine nucleotide exchange factor J
MEAGLADEPATAIHTDTDTDAGTTTMTTTAATSVTESLRSEAIEGSMATLSVSEPSLEASDQDGHNEADMHEHEHGHEQEEEGEEAEEEAIENMNVSNAEIAPEHLRSSSDLLSPGSVASISAASDVSVHSSIATSADSEKDVLRDMSKGGFLNPDLEAVGPQFSFAELIDDLRRTKMQDVTIPLFDMVVHSHERPPTHRMSSNKSSSRHDHGGASTVIGSGPENGRKRSDSAGSSSSSYGGADDPEIPDVDRTSLDPHVQEAFRVFRAEWKQVKRRNAQFLKQTDGKWDSSYFEQMLSTKEKVSSSGGVGEKDDMDNLDEAAEALASLKESIKNPLFHTARHGQFTWDGGREHLFCGRRDLPPYSQGDDATRFVLSLSPVQFAVGRVEPHHVKVFLFDGAANKKISEDLVLSVTNGMTTFSNSHHIPYTRALFQVSRPSSRVFLCIWIERVLQGSLEVSSKGYSEPACSDRKKVDPDVMRARAMDYCTRLGQVRQPLAWGCVPIFYDTDNGTVLSLHDGILSVSKLYFCPFLSAERFEWNEVFGQSDAFLEQKYKRISARLMLCVTPVLANHLEQMVDLSLAVDEDVAHSMLESTETTVKESDAELIQVNGSDGSPQRKLDEMLPKDKDSTRSRKRSADIALRRWIFEEQLRHSFHFVPEFPVQVPRSPYFHYSHQLYVYPLSVNLSAIKNVSARNIRVDVYFRTDDNVNLLTATMAPTAHNLIDKSNTVRMGSTSVTHHQRVPNFYDELKVTVPLPPNRKHHVLFVFYHVRCKSSLEERDAKDKGDGEEPDSDVLLGYSFLPVSESGIFSDNTYRLPGFRNIKDGYTSAGVQSSMEKIDKAKNLFAVTVCFTSTLYAQDPAVESFYSNVKPLLQSMDMMRKRPAHFLDAAFSSAQQSMTNLRGARFHTLVPYLPVLFNLLFHVMCNVQELSQQPEKTEKPASELGFDSDVTGESPVTSSPVVGGRTRSFSVMNRAPMEAGGSSPNLTTVTANKNLMQKYSQWIEKVQRACFLTALSLLRGCAHVEHDFSRRNAVLASYVQYILDHIPRSDGLSPLQQLEKSRDKKPNELFFVICEQWLKLLLENELSDRPLEMDAWIPGHAFLYTLKTDLVSADADNMFRDATFGNVAGMDSSNPGVSSPSSSASPLNFGDFDSMSNGSSKSSEEMLAQFGLLLLANQQTSWDDSPPIDDVLQWLSFVPNNQTMIASTPLTGDRASVIPAMFEEEDLSFFEDESVIDGNTASHLDDIRQYANTVDGRIVCDLRKPPLKNVPLPLSFTKRYVYPLGTVLKRFSSISNRLIHGLTQGMPRDGDEEAPQTSSDKPRQGVVKQISDSIFAISVQSSDAAKSGAVDDDAIKSSVSPVEETLHFSWFFFDVMIKSMSLHIPVVNAQIAELQSMGLHTEADVRRRQHDELITNFFGNAKIVVAHVVGHVFRMAESSSKIYEQTILAPFVAFFMSSQPSKADILSRRMRSGKKSTYLDPAGAADGPMNVFAALDHGIQHPRCIFERARRINAQVALFLRDLLSLLSLSYCGALVNTYMRYLEDAYSGGVALHAFGLRADVVAILVDHEHFYDYALFSIAGKGDCGMMPTLLPDLVRDSLSISREDLAVLYANKNKSGDEFEHLPLAIDCVRYFYASRVWFVLADHLAKVDFDARVELDRKQLIASYYAPIILDIVLRPSLVSHTKSVALSVGAANRRSSTVSTDPSEVILFNPFHDFRAKSHEMCAVSMCLLWLLENVQTEKVLIPWLQSLSLEQLSNFLFSLSRCASCLCDKAVDDDLRRRACMTISSIFELVIRNFDDKYGATLSVKVPQAMYDDKKAVYGNSPYQEVFRGLFDGATAVLSSLLECFSPQMAPASSAASVGARDASDSSKHQRSMTTFIVPASFTEGDRIRDDYLLVHTLPMFLQVMMKHPFIALFPTSNWRKVVGLILPWTQFSKTATKCLSLLVDPFLEMLARNEEAVMSSSFAQLDDERSIIYDNGNGDNSNGAGDIKAATEDKLVECLTMGAGQDLNFRQVFFLTYRSFMTPRRLLRKLILRFDPFSATCPQSQQTPAQASFSASGSTPLSGSELGSGSPVVSSPMLSINEDDFSAVRLRVCNAIKHWIDKYFYDFSVPLLAILIRFLEEDIGAKYSANTARQLKRALERKLLGFEEEMSLVFKHSPPKSLIPKVHSPSLSILEWSPMEIARQMTLIESELFRKIEPKECLGNAFGKKNKNELAPNIIASVNHFNRASRLIVQWILNEEDVRKRKDVLKRVIEIADCLRSLNNYNGVNEVVSGLGNAAVHRLKKTWEQLPAASDKTYKELETLVAHPYARLREALRNSNPPCVPYTGVYLTDLTFIEEGNKDVVTEHELINFGKRRQVARVIMEMRTYQQTPYHFEEVPFLRDFLKYAPIQEENELWKVSLVREPRDKR